ncbi:hypothetical protein [Ancylobacter pratisalsi]|uniref:Uncharacterized protein n=1 Tax=Ancylobacter pratisalsi TaxID=1745854 RepID=A0A6P1YND4_9HYPH|nr:hypothetical protein [Ancylobacter pratisalsi]QIB34216.1 hypothetical protein G3A50_11235 [Ancylobacter pratisalsi]
MSAPVVSATDYLRTGRAAAPPLFSTLFETAATLEDADMAELMAEPARLTRALVNMQRLLGTHTVAVRFDRIIRQAAGEDPVPQGTEPHSMDLPLPDPDAVRAAAAPLLDTVARLAAELKRALPVMVMLPGPTWFGSGTDAQAAAQGGAILRGLIEACCTAGAGLVLILGREGSDRDLFAQFARPLANTAHYYAKPVIVADTRVPRSLADALLMPWGGDAGPTLQIDGGQRLGHRLPAIDPAMGGETGSGWPVVPPGTFLAIGDDTLRGMTGTAIAQLAERLPRAY